MRARIEAQGGLLTLKLLDQKPRPAPVGAVRGKIRAFTAKSRLRLMRFMARLQVKNIRATFMTLTFKGFPTNAQAKASLHAFVQHIRRNFPHASAVWRMEYQQRGAIHFHLLCFNLPYWHWTEILATWKRITHQEIARIDVRLVKSRRGVMSYVSKYIAKVEKRSGKTFFIQAPYLHGMRKWKKGRFWGYHNKGGLPLGQQLVGILTDAKLIKKLSNAAWEIIGAASRYNSVSFQLFTERAAHLWTEYIRIGGLTIDEWRNSQQVTRREYADMAFITKRFSERDFENDNRQAVKVSSRSRAARNVQPCTKTWLDRSSFLSRASGAFASIEQV